MASYMSVKTGILPVGIVRGLWLESGSLAVRSQQPVRVERKKIAYVHIFGMLELTSGQPYTGHRKTLHNYGKGCRFGLGISGEAKDQRGQAGA